MCSSSNLATLEELNLNSTAKFTTQEEYELLAELIDTAENLKKLKIKGQRGHKVRIEIDYAILSDSSNESIVPKEGTVRIERNKKIPRNPFGPPKDEGASSEEDEI